MQLRAHHFVALLILFSFILSSSCSSSSTPLGSTSKTSKQSIKWDVQFNTSEAIFQTVGMCKGTTDKTRKVGFIVGFAGSIWRTLDGVSWSQVADFNFTNSAYWYGVYCFPDAKRVIALGLTDTDEHNRNGAVISWSFDGGDTWTDRQPMPHAQNFTWLGSAYFYNDTHGFILPNSQDELPLTYYTTNGGKTASDWQVGNSNGSTTWAQYPIWVFGDVTTTLATGPSGPELCYTEDAGMTWGCDVLNQVVGVASFVTPKDAIGVDYTMNVYTTRDGLNFAKTSALPFFLANAMGLPADMVWIPNSDVIILAGGNIRPTYKGTVAQSMDGGLTWTQSLPQLSPTTFDSLDWVATSPTTTEVWVVGYDGASSIVLHGIVTIG